jgi:hypothetical protein
LFALDESEVNGLEHELPLSQSVAALAVAARSALRRVPIEDTTERFAEKRLFAVDRLLETSGILEIAAH